MIRIIAATVAALFFLNACSREPETAIAPEPSPETRRMTSHGEITGVVTPDGAHAWLGVPYAQPPVGDLRWRPAQPFSGFDGRFEAHAYAARCPQLTNALNEAEGIEPGLLLGQEDCLGLDIYAPPHASVSDRLPVMVWIHGGGNVWGRSSSYDASRLAIRQNVVVAAIQYRIGPLGWFAHPALDEDPAAPGQLANFALTDMIEALRWIERDIAAFGGDPERVTIFGESAGGANVAALLASPLAAGLFDRAILQSGSIESAPLDQASGAAPGAANAAIPAAERFAGEDADAAALRAASLEDIFKAYGEPGGGILPMPTMIADGVSLPLDGMRSAFAADGGFNRVPVITGANKDEMKLFQALDRDLVDRWFGVIVRPKDPDFYDALSDHQTAMWRATAVDELAQRLRAAGHEDVWAYRFDWDEGGRILLTDLATLMGAAHALEIPFVFNRFQLLGPLDRVMFNTRNKAGREALSAAMGAWWGAFAANGDPAGAGGIEWPRYGENARLMRLDSPQDGGPEVISGALTPQAVAEQLAQDERIGPAERCRIAEAVTGRYGFASLVFEEETGCSL